MTVSEYTPENSAFVVFLTSASYTAGVILLDYSIKQHSKYPLIVAVTPGLTPESTISFLRDAGFTIRELSPLLPPASRKRSLIAERFRDTWTKLRIFEMDDFKVRWIDYIHREYRNMRCDSSFKPYSNKNPIEITQIANPLQLINSDSSSSTQTCY